MTKTALERDLGWAVNFCVYNPSEGLLFWILGEVFPWNLKPWRTFFPCMIPCLQLFCLNVHFVVFSSPLHSPLHVTPTSLTMKVLVTCNIITDHHNDSLCNYLKTPVKCLMPTNLVSYSSCPLVSYQLYSGSVVDAAAPPLSVLFSVHFRWTV